MSNTQVTPSIDASMEGTALGQESSEFDKHHRAWQFNGPKVKLEFSRKSASRLGALTLVIDPIHGEECKVAYALVIS